MNSNYLDNYKKTLETKCEDQCDAERKRTDRLVNDLDSKMPSFRFGLFIFTAGLFLIYFLIRRSSLSRQMDDIEMNCERNIRRFQQQRDSDYQAMTKQYEQLSNQRRKHYASSPQLQPIVDWLTSGYMQRIKTADRDPHIQTVTVMLSFHVMLDRIMVDSEPGRPPEYGFREFNFKIQRIANLDSMYDCIGLGNALADRLKIEIKRLCPVDAAGGVTLVQSRSNDSDIDLRYLATNGRFKQAIVI